MYAGALASGVYWERQSRLAFTTRGGDDIGNTSGSHVLSVTRRVRGTLLRYRASDGDLQMV